MRRPSGVVLPRVSISALAEKVEEYVRRLFVDVDQVSWVGCSTQADDAFLTLSDLPQDLNILRLTLTGVDDGSNSGVNLNASVYKSTDGGSSWAQVATTSVTSTGAAATLYSSVDVDVDFARTDWLELRLSHPGSTPFPYGSMAIGFKTYVPYVGRGQ